MISSLLIKPAGPDCNLACSYCFYADKEALFQRGTHRVGLPLLEHALREYLEIAGPSAAIGFQGGEPTLCGPAFFEEALCLIRRLSRPGQRVSVAIQTNGILIDDRWALLLKRHGVLVGLSIDGPENAHDGYRRDPSGHPSHGRAAAALSTLLGAGIQVNTLTVVHAGNVGMGASLIDALLEMGSRYLQFIPCVEASGGGTADFSVAADEYGAFLCSAFDRWYGDGIPGFYVRMFDELLISFIEYQDPSCQRGARCHANLVIEHNGDVYPCDFFVDPALRLGCIGVDALRDMAISPMLQAFLAHKNRLPADCIACRWRPLCQGDCPKYRLGGKPYLCEAYRAFFTHAVPKLRALKARLYDGDPRGPGWKRREASIQRNSPCPCGSGAKAKSCCLPIKA